jgi:hypothetical protein
MLGVYVAVMRINWGAWVTNLRARWLDWFSGCFNGMDGRYAKMRMWQEGAYLADVNVKWQDVGEIHIKCRKIRAFPSCQLFKRRDSVLMTAMRPYHA